LVLLTEITILGGPNHAGHAIATNGCNKGLFRSVGDLCRFIDVSEEGVAGSVGLGRVVEGDVFEIDVVELGGLFDLFVEEESVVVGGLFGDGENDRNGVDHPEILVISSVNFFEQVDHPLLKSTLALISQLKVLQDNSPHTTKLTPQTGNYRLLDLAIIIINELMGQILFDPDGLVGEGS
jgi:hypothetical protein